MTAVEALDFIKSYVRPDVNIAITSDNETGELIGLAVVSDLGILSVGVQTVNPSDDTKVVCWSDGPTGPSWSRTGESTSKKYSSRWLR